jgi:hypothetical protein
MVTWKTTGIFLETVINLQTYIDLPFSSLIVHITQYMANNARLTNGNCFTFYFLPG